MVWMRRCHHPRQGGVHPASGWDGSDGVPETSPTLVAEPADGLLDVSALPGGAAQPGIRGQRGSERAGRRGRREFPAASRSRTTAFAGTPWPFRSDFRGSVARLVGAVP